MRYNILFLSLFCFQSFAQERQTDLISNTYLGSVIKDRSFEHKSILSLPFIDDFSYDRPYPDTNLWQGESVFVNRKYGVNPITIGVATFDGLDKFGRAYDMTLTGTDSEHADTLTSHKIDLSNSDTVYLMFCHIKLKYLFESIFCCSI